MRNNLRRIYGKEVGQAEENQRVNAKGNSSAALGDERMNTCVEGYSGCTRNSEQRTDGQGADNRNRACVQRMHGHGHGVGVIAFFHRHRQHAHERKAYTAEAEAQHTQRKVFACQLSENGRENKIARAEEEGKQHEADGDD